MGKLFNVALFGAVITAALLLLNGSQISTDSIFYLMFTADGWETHKFYLLMTSMFTLSGAIVIGLAAIIRQDWVLRAGIVAALNSILIAPYLDLFRYVVAQTGYISSGCITSPICTNMDNIQGMGQIFGFIFVGPLILYALWTCLNYVFVAESSG